MSAGSASAIGRSSDETRIKPQNPRLPSEVHSTKEGRRNRHLARRADGNGVGARPTEEAGYKNRVRFQHKSRVMGGGRERENEKKWYKWRSEEVVRSRTAAEKYGKIWA